jgi:hypothetical protein
MGQQIPKQVHSSQICGVLEGRRYAASGRTHFRASIPSTSLFMQSSTSSISATVLRALALWLFSNLGGTVMLGMILSLGRLEDATIALMAGLLAVIITLPLVPLAVPFLALLSRLQPGWSRRSIAMVGVTLFFVLANQLLVMVLPFLSSVSLLEMTAPYLSTHTKVIV